MIRIPTLTALITAPLHYAGGYLSGVWWIIGETSEGTPPHDFYTALVRKAYAKAGVYAQAEWSFVDGALLPSIGVERLKHFFDLPPTDSPLCLAEARVQWGVGVHAGRIAALTVGGVDLDPMWVMLARDWGAEIHAPADGVCALTYEGVRIGALLAEEP